MNSVRSEPENRRTADGMQKKEPNSRRNGYTTSGLVYVRITGRKLNRKMPFLSVHGVKEIHLEMLNFSGVL